jgi:hypothetical protein
LCYQATQSAEFGDYIAFAGTDIDPDAVFWNTKNSGYYSDGGSAGVGIFRQDTNWTEQT